MRIGKLQPLEAINFKSGNKVLTIKGIGTIIDFDLDIDEIPVYIISIGNGSFHIREYGRNILQFFIYHERLKIYIPVSFSDYNIIKKNNMPVKYRITKRGFAKIITEKKI